MSFYCGPPCDKEIKAVPKPDGSGGYYECEDGHRFGGWVEAGKLDIGITPETPPTRNDLALFFEEFKEIESAGISWFGQSGPCPEEEP